MEEKEPLQPDGHVVLTINGVEYDCRRPTAGEYLELMGEAAEMTEKLMEQRANTEISVFEKNKQTLEMSQHWFLNVLKMLASPAFEGTESDVPIWAVSNLSNEILGHWISRPLAHRGES